MPGASPYRRGTVPLTWTATMIRVDRRHAGASARSRRSTARRARRSAAARSSRCSARPAAGRRRSCALIAGFERPTAGRSRSTAASVAGPRRLGPAEARRVGMVFQDYALFPHLTVAENVGFGLPRGERARRVPALLAVVDLVRPGRALSRTSSPAGSSSASRSRARSRPRRRSSCSTSRGRTSTRCSAPTLRDEVAAVLRPLGVTAILVTHDREEAFSLADRIALMRDGRVVQVGTAEELYFAPALALGGRVRRRRRTCSPGRVDGAARRTRRSARSPANGGVRRTVEVLVRPELVELAPDPDGRGEVVGARVPRSRRLLPRPARRGRARRRSGRRTRSSRSVPGSRSGSTRVASPSSARSSCCKVCLTSRTMADLTAGGRMKAIGGLAVLARSGGARGLRRRRRGERAAHGLLGSRGGARRAAVRAVHRGDGDRGRGALRRLGRARGDDRRGGRELARRRLLRAGPGLARRGRRRSSPSCPRRSSSASTSGSATRTAAGSARPVGRACSSTTPSELAEDELPGSVLDLTEPEWKGRVGIAPTNASFQAFVTAMRLDARRRRDARVARGDEGERREDVREEHADRRGGRRRRDRRRASSTTTTSRS